MLPMVTAPNKRKVASAEQRYETRLLISQASRKDNGLSPMQPHKERLHRQARDSICSSTSSDLARRSTGSIACRSTISNRMSLSVLRPRNAETMRNCKFVSGICNIGMMRAKQFSFTMIWWLLGFAAKLEIANAAVLRISMS